MSAAWIVHLVLLVALIAGAAAGPRPGDQDQPAPPEPGLTVLPQRPSVPGYQRDCGPGQGCSFGPRWSDGHPGLGGHNGCDTRNDVLARQALRFTRAGSCRVSQAVILDPYTGRLLTYTRGQSPSPVQIDHVYPLALAWDMGAWRWPPPRRIAFANDQLRNLLAVSAQANRAKSSRGPGLWRPADPALAQVYVCRFAQVAAAYGLPVTVQDSAAIHRYCPTADRP